MAQQWRICLQSRRCRLDLWVGKAPKEGMAADSSILGWRIPRTEEPGGLQPIGSQRVRHDCSDWAHIHRAVAVVHDLSQAVHLQPNTSFFWIIELQSTGLMDTTQAHQTWLIGFALVCPTLGKPFLKISTWLYCINSIAYLLHAFVFTWVFVFALNVIWFTR